MSLLDDLVELYDTQIIFKAIVVCGDEAACDTVQGYLEARDHSVARIRDEELADERPLHLARLRQFTDNHCRVLVLSYASWYAMADPHLLLQGMDHNLLVLAGVSEQNARYVVDFFHPMRTPRMRQMRYHVLWTSGEEIEAA